MLVTKVKEGGIFSDTRTISKRLDVRHAEVVKRLRNLLGSMQDVDTNHPDLFCVTPKTTMYRSQNYTYYEMSFGFTVLLCMQFKAGLEISMLTIAGLAEHEQNLPDVASEWAFTGIIDALLKTNTHEAPKKKEQQLRKKLVYEWMFIFPCYDILEEEYLTVDGDRIDILAQEIAGLKRHVIIELKASNVSAHKQLRSYAHEFDNPILINFTPGRVDKRAEGITYASLADS